PYHTNVNPRLAQYYCYFPRIPGAPLRLDTRPSARPPPPPFHGQRGPPVRRGHPRSPVPYPFSNSVGFSLVWLPTIPAPSRAVFTAGTGMALAPTSRAWYSARVGEVLWMI